MDFSINGEYTGDCDGHEFNAITEDFLTPEHFHIRQGDNAEYESVDSLDDLDLELRELGAFTGWVPLGFTTDLYRGNNYVSLYKSKTVDKGPNFELGYAEKQFVKRKLREALKQPL